MKSVLILACLLALLPVHSFAQTAPAPVVMELFTSQGCAYCPPADALLGEVAKQPGIIALSCHVDYFPVSRNSLGKSFCTQRQNRYRGFLKKPARYTPQLVINGRRDMIGYEGDKVSMALMRARGERLVNIPIVPSGDGTYKFTLPLTDLGGQTVNLWMALFDAPHSMPILEGNNFGKTVTYHNVVTRVMEMNSWSGVYMDGNVTPGFERDSAGFAIIAQSLTTGEIVAAGQIMRDAGGAMPALSAVPDPLL